MIQYTNRLSHLSAVVTALQAKTELFKRALIDQGERLVFAQVGAQMLENYNVGAEWKEGEWERADGGDWGGGGGLGVEQVCAGLGVGQVCTGYILHPRMRFLIHAR